MSINFKKHLVEGLMIVFSVLFALFINKAYADYQTTKRKKIALESIRKELAQNEWTVKRWHQQHSQIQERIKTILNQENDSLLQAMKQYKFFNLGILTNDQSLIDGFITNTAWESVKASGIISEFDFMTIQELTRVYSMQEVIMDRTLAQILDYFFDTSAHDMDNLEKNLIQFQLRFIELVGQETLLLELYAAAKNQLGQ